MKHEAHVRVGSGLRNCFHDFILLRIIEGGAEVKVVDLAAPLWPFEREGNETAWNMHLRCHTGEMSKARASDADRHPAGILITAEEAAVRVRDELSAKCFEIS
eukprot:4883800-Pyramimonas_sp.AAC.1